MVIRKHVSATCCWRNIDDDGAKTCSGAATILKLTLGIPVMLILEMPADWEGQKENQWSFPDHIRPLTAGAEAMHGVVYDIVGRVLTNGGHFKAIFTPDGKHLYSYDGDENGGKPKRVRLVGPDGDESDFSDSQRPVKKRRSNLVLSDEESETPNPVINPHLSIMRLTVVAGKGEAGTPLWSPSYLLSAPSVLSFPTSHARVLYPPVQSSQVQLRASYEETIGTETHEQE
ncbi:hypothetical protein B0H13DRAFT_1896201 [Mycena leptocephala]|nr:hypothetical protein B0H13DRAFT_1896201 [Mycena leptocephala]